MQTFLLAVGKLRPYFRHACDDYLRRIRRYGRIEEREIREAPRAANPAVSRRDESHRLARLLPPESRVVVLDRTGRAWTSDQLAAELDHWRERPGSVALVVGGATGLEAGFPQGRTNRVTRWSLGPLTLPHELARVVVLEQLYRAWTILRGEPYHR
ncbi:MAG: 23S rRNA (pseudouridine(1915)-N(3))-methyltransferase RlmH [Gemmatimonadales bacterium]